MRFKLTLIGLGIALLATACAPSESEQIATITQIAAGIIATQTAQAPTATPVTPTPTLSPGATRTSPVDGMTMVYVPGGEFTLGSTQADVDWAIEACLEFHDDCDASYYEDELPQHTVQLDPFWIDQTEVTAAMFAQFVDETSYETDAERFQYSLVFYKDEWDRVRDADWRHPLGTDAEAKDDDPVVNVSWYDAWAYCEWAGRRLPTEAEWEAAARGTDLPIFPWGNAAPSDTLANLADKSLSYTDWRNREVDDGYYETAPVTSYPEGASPFGVLGMAGNVKEWVYDGYAPGYDLPPSEQNPVNSADTEKRVNRGGSYASALNDARAANRRGLDPLESISDYGFRCVFSNLTLPDPPEKDLSLPDMVLIRWQPEIYITPGSSEKHGKLKSIKDVEITGQYNQCRYLRISTPDYPEGWLKVDDNIVLYKDCAEFEEIFIRPESANWKFMGEGHGTLTVKNQEETDAYIVLYRSESERDPDEKDYMYEYWMYIRAGEQATMENIPDGTYELYVTNGTTWVAHEGRFRDAVSYEKLTELLEYTSTATQATWWEIILETVEGGNTGSVLIDEDDFP
jgi:formylglycine-generating enzyme required for sulfatase activity